VGSSAATGKDERMARHRVLTPLRWSDMDAYGHVNNVQFLRLLEDARVVALAARGSDEGGSVVDTGLLVARSEIEYLAPLVYRTSPVAIDLWVTGIAGASFDMGYEVLDEAGEDGALPQVYARAETTLVLYDLVNNRPRRMSEKERKTLQDWKDGPVHWRKRRTSRPGA
jgi:acyl-CoA thioester hydrolase